MQRCSHCNAPIQDDVEQCTFCGTVTEQGRKVRVDRAARDEAASRQREVEQREATRKGELQAAAAKSRSIQEAHQSANRSLMWSLLGILACCLPLGPIIGIVMARRARELALKNHVSTTHSTVATAVAIGCVLITIGMWLGVALISRAEANRKAELKVAIAKGDAAAELSVDTACAMTELELLSSKYEHFDNLNDELICGSRMVREGDEARLLDSHFTNDGKRVAVVACFKHGERWAITQVRGDEQCDQPPPAPTKP